MGLDWLGLKSVTEQPEPFSVNLLGILIAVFAVALVFVWLPVFLFMKAFDSIGDWWRKRER